MTKNLWPWLPVVVLVLILSLYYIIVIRKAHPAEGPVQIQEDYTAIMEQAENWPVDGKSWAAGTLGKTHKDPKNPDRAMLALWFPNRNSNQLEEFARIIFLWSNQKAGELNNSLAAMLKTENGIWVAGDYLRTGDARLNGEKAVAFRLFIKSNPNNPIAVRNFLLK